LKYLILEERGYFWWHDANISAEQFVPDINVTGLLTIDENGYIELELDGVLPESNIFKPPHKFIQGILKDTGQYVLLLELFLNGGRFSTGEISYSKYMAFNCVISDFLLQLGKNVTVFNSLEIELKGFEEWIPLTSIKLENTETGVSAEYTKQDDIVYLLDDGQLILKFNLDDSYGDIFGGGITDKRNSVSWRETASLTYSFSEQVSLETIKHQIKLLEELLVLLTNADNCLDWATLFLDGDKKCTLYSERYHRNTISIIPKNECLIGFEQISGDFGNIFSTWKRQTEEFGSGIYLYFANRKNNGYLENRFLYSVTGIESFYSVKFPNPARIPIENPETVKRVLNQIDFDKITDEHDKKWLRKKLPLDRKPYLKEQIYQLFKSLPFDFNQENITNFAKSCADHRNVIAHNGGAKDVGYTSCPEFAIDLDRKLKPLLYLYHFLILQEIGVDEILLKAVFYKTSLINHIEYFELLARREE
jgi:hypothetical protein